MTAIAMLLLWDRERPSGLASSRRPVPQRTHRNDAVYLPRLLAQASQLPGVGTHHIFRHTDGHLTGDNVINAIPPPGNTRDTFAEVPAGSPGPRPGGEPSSTPGRKTRSRSLPVLVELPRQYDSKWRDGWSCRRVCQVRVMPVPTLTESGGSLRASLGDALRYLRAGAKL